MHNLALADACLVLFEILACGDTCLQQHFGLFLSAKKKKKKILRCLSKQNSM